MVVITFTVAQKHKTNLLTDCAVNSISFVNGYYLGPEAKNLPSVRRIKL